MSTQCFASFTCGYEYEKISHAVQSYENPDVQEYLDEIAIYLTEHVDGCNEILSKEVIRDGVFGIELQFDDFKLFVFNSETPADSGRSAMRSIKCVKKMNKEELAPSDSDLGLWQNNAKIKQNLGLFIETVESANFQYRNKSIWEDAQRYYDRVMHCMIYQTWKCSFNENFRSIPHETRKFMDHKLASGGCFYCFHSWAPDTTWYLATIFKRPLAREIIKEQLSDWSRRFDFALEDKVNHFDTMVKQIQDMGDMERSLAVYDEIMYTLYDRTLGGRFNKALEGDAEYVRRYMNSILEDKGLTYTMYTPDSKIRNAEHARWFLIMQY